MALFSGRDKNLPLLTRLYQLGDDREEILRFIAEQTDDWQAASFAKGVLEGFAPDVLTGEQAVPALRKYRDLARRMMQGLYRESGVTGFDVNAASMLSRAFRVAYPLADTILDDSAPVLGLESALPASAFKIEWLPDNKEPTGVSTFAFKVGNDLMDLFDSVARGEKRLAECPVCCSIFVINETGRPRTVGTCSSRCWHTLKARERRRNKNTSEKPTPVTQTFA